MDERLYNLTEASEHFGVDKRTISDLVKKWELETQPVRSNGMARGLTTQQISFLADKLNAVPV